MTTTNDGTAGTRRPGRPRKVDARDTKDVLTQVALRLFARNGFAGTSIRAIAREVGLSESVLYAHFDSKQAIFDAVLAEFGPQSYPEVLSTVDTDLIETDPARFLRNLVSAFLDEWDGEQARLLISLMTKDGLLHSPALRDGLSAMRGFVAELFDRWIEAGRIRENFGSPQDLALSFTGPIGLTRLLYLHANATEEERATARADILRHVRTFGNAVLRD